ncbi:MAG: hypothetical protein HC884_03105 [Chloroflexaceae bacterium]|nr:hypothetical protein [Chloroflexaceae bacterium]
MVEEWLVLEDELLGETPLLRRFRQEREEGREEGRLEGQEEGRLKGRLEGQEEGRLTARQEAIVDMVRARFHPTEAEVREVEAALTTITSEARLRALLLVGMEADTLAVFRGALEEE